jgi:rhodanese-related sulfurtransferase
LTFTNAKQDIIWPVNYDTKDNNALEDQLLLLRLLKAESSNSSLPYVENLLAKIKKAHYPVVIWGAEWSGNDPYLTRELMQAQLRWVRHASMKCRLHHLSLCQNPGVMNFASVANWLTGNVSGLSFLLNQASTDPLYYSSSRLIKDREISTVCWIGQMSYAIKSLLLNQGINVYQIALPSTGLETGTYLRDDGVPVHLKENQHSLSETLNYIKIQYNRVAV